MNAIVTHLKPHLLGLLLMVLIFLVEMYTGALVGTVAYIFVMLSLLWLTRTSRYLLVLGSMASFFILLGFVLFFNKVENNLAFIINRSLSVAVVWLAVYFTIRFRKIYFEQRTKTDQLKALFENAHEGILFTDVQGKILLANPFLEKMFGYQPGELLNSNISVLIPDKMVQGHAEHMKNFEQRPENRHQGHDLKAKHKGGDDFPVEISLSHFYERGQLTIISFILDVREKRKHQQLIEASLNSIKNHNLELEQKVKQRTQELEHTNRELRKSQSLYKAMAQNFPDGIIGVLDRDLKYLLVGGEDLRPCAQGAKETTDNRRFDEIHTAMIHYGEGAIQKVFLGENLTFDIEVQDRVYNIAAVPLVGSHQEIHEILVVVKNITGQKQLERKLIKTLEKEKELSLLKSRFVTTASHEFRSPLTTILSSAFLLSQYSGDRLEREKKKHLERINRAVQGMTELLSDFLSLGKLEEGKVQVKYSEIDLIQFMEELLQDAVYLTKENQQLTFQLEGEDTHAETDKGLLRNILMNLISNAIKYTAAPSPITLTAGIANQQLMITVKDQGIGIPPEEQKHIFKRFFRAKNAAEIQGTGLGLNIARKYVKLLQGDISFTSNLMQGTTFTVALPVPPDRKKTGQKLSKITMP